MPLTDAMPSLPISLDGPGRRRGSPAPSAPRTARSSWRAARRTWRPLGPATNAESKLPGVVPPTTVFLVEGHDVGKTLTRSRTSSPTCPSSRIPSPSWTMPSRSLAAPRPSPAGSARPASRSRSTATEIAGGLVIVPDRCRGRRQAARASSRPSSSWAAPRPASSVTEEHYNGTTITVVDLSGLGGLAGDMTAGRRRPCPTDLKLAYAVTDEVVVLRHRHRLREGRPRRAAPASRSPTPSGSARR